MRRLERLTGRLAPALAAGIAAVLMLGSLTAVARTAPPAEPRALGPEPVLTPLWIGPVLEPGEPPAEPAPVFDRPEARPDRAAEAPREPSGFRWPVHGSWAITSPFGWRQDPIEPERWAFHWGTDIGCSIGTPVRAARGGTVIYAGELDVYGTVVAVRHDGGYMTIYAHLSALRVEPLASVASRDVVGLCGDTGRATGPHVHFEIRHNDKPLDPVSLLR